MKKQTVEERRTEILEVTCQVVIERGFAGTRISDVAKRLDVSSSLIHYHFDSKEQLLAEAFSHYARKDLAEMENDVQAAPTATAQLDNAIHNYVPEGSGDVEWMLWIDGWGEALRNPMMRKISQELDAQSAELLERVIANGVESGEFVCADPRATAMRLTALVDGLAIQFAAHDGMMNRADLIGHVRTVAAAEVGISPGAFDAVHGDAAEAAGAAGRGTPSATVETALRRLVDRYADAVVRGDVTGWLDTWTADGEWTPAGATRTVSGRDNLLTAWKRATAGLLWTVHTPGACVFEVDERAGTGSGRVTVQEWQRRATGRPSTLFATYHDTYRREAGEWRFASRRVTSIEPA